MNTSLSAFLIAPPASGSELNFLPPSAVQSAAPAPFCRLLDHAVQEIPARNRHPDRSERPHAAVAPGAKSRPAADLPNNERRELPRLKNQKRDRADTENLAGAIAVNGSPAPGDDAPATTDSAAAAQAGPTDSATDLPAAKGDRPGRSVAATTTTTSGATATESLATAALLEMTSPEVTPSKDLLKSAATPDAAATATEAKPLLLAAPERNVTPSPGAVIPVQTDPAAFVSAQATELAVATTATDLVAPEEVRREAQAVRRAQAEALENPAGIGGAKSSATMKTAIKKENLAGSALQFLPGSPVGPEPTQRNLPGEAGRSSIRNLAGIETFDFAAKTMVAPTPAEVSSNSDPALLRSNSPITRISEVISREVRMFKRGGDDLVEVVLTPDAKTQISLRLQWREGQVEVQARCDLGDYQTLNTQWSQLQASLASHGVRLSHLSERVPTGFTEFFNHPSFSQQSGGDRQSAARANNPEPLPAPERTITKTAAGRTQPRSNRLFDSWA